nr:G protein-coupled receptor [Proales similis]
MYVRSLSDSLLARNKFSLVLPSDAKNENLSSNINRIELSTYLHEISERQLPDWMLQSTVLLQIFGKLLRLHPINWPKEVQLRFANWRQFFHLNVNMSQEWFATGRVKQIMYSIIWAPDELSGYTVLAQNAYLFPDHDFCLFSKHFDQDPNRFYVIQSIRPIECSCTIVWLLQNYNNDEDIPYTGRSQFSSCTKNLSLPALVAKCNFTSRLNFCSEFDFKQGTGFEWSQVDLAACLKMLKFYMVVIIFPIQSLLVIVFNVLSGIALRSMIAGLKKKINDSRSQKLAQMYQYLIYQTFAAALNGLIFVFKPMSVCVDFASSFCSSVYLEPFVRIYTLLIIDYGAASVSLFSNFCLFFFTLIRFRFNSKQTWRLDKYLYYERLYFYAFVLLSLLLAVPRLFTMTDYGTLLAEADALRLFFQPSVFSLKGLQSNQRKFPFVQLDLTFAAIKNILLPCITLSLDVVFLIHLRKINKERAENLNMSSNNRSEEKMNKMVAINGIFFFLLRIPDLILTAVMHNFFKVVSDRNQQLGETTGTCLDSRFPLGSTCENATQIMQVIYESANLVTFIVLYRFNGAFKKNLLEALRFPGKKS